MSEQYVVVELDAETQIISEGFQGPPGQQGAQGVSAGAIQRTAPFAMSGHRIVAEVGGQLVYASAATPAHAGQILGMTMNAADPGAFVEIRQDGDVTEPSWSFTPDRPVYLGANGQLTQTPPTAPDFAFLQVIGFATAANRIFLNPTPPIYLTE